MNEEFYIGWEAKAAPGIGRTVRKAVIIVSLIALFVPLALAISQRMIGVSVFEWGNHKTFTGILQTTPYPHLLVSRPGQTGDSEAFSTYYLVAPWKFGLKPESIEGLNGQNVTLQGTLIYRGDQTMIEVVPDSIQTSTNELRRARSDAPHRAFGKQTLVGEIVDSKCWLGVMNPGQLTPHRACAIRCISGGVPPVLLVRRKDGPPLYFLLVSAEGKPINKQVLDLVAEPIEVSGEVEKQGKLLILRADPTTYRRVD